MLTHGGTEARRLSNGPFRRVHLWTAGLVVVVDQAVKMAVRDRFDLFESVVVIPGFFSLTRVHNTGAAFGMLGDIDFAFKAVLLAIVAVVALVFLTMYAATLEPGQGLTRFGLALVIGGALGNLIDRVSTGYVLDFFDFFWRGWHFWAFNIADASITVGVSLMVLDLLRGAIRRPRTSNLEPGTRNLEPRTRTVEAEPGTEHERRSENREA